MNKKIVVSVGIGILCVTLFGAYQATANKGTRYQMDKAVVTSKPFISNPDGKSVSLSSIDYVDNSAIDKSKLKKPAELEDYLSDKQLSALNATRSMQQLMTYEEYYNLGFTKALRHDIDPNRLVWVIQVKHSKPITVSDSTVEQAVVTTMYDAETGEQLDINVSSLDPHGMDQLKHSRNK